MRTRGDAPSLDLSGKPLGRRAFRPEGFSSLRSFGLGVKFLDSLVHGLLSSLRKKAFRLLLEGILAQSSNILAPTWSISAST